MFRLLPYKDEKSTFNRKLTHYLNIQPQTQ